mmetsp:Transcript_123748/g.321431  ORF Transcript_123748/g.321431 Transcript_123748/m.321431 type:complete len:279 (+) Transcript_123748:708-1544(+)
MCFLELVEEHDGVGVPSQSLGELASFFMPNIPRWGADQPRDRMLFHVLGHVQADHLGVGVEELHSQRLRHLGLAHPGRPREEEGAHGPVPAFQASRAYQDRPGHCVRGLILAQDASLERRAQLQEALALGLRESLHWDPCPAGHHLSDVVGGDHLPQHGEPLCFLHLQLLEALLQLRDGLVAEVRNHVHITPDLGHLHLAFQRLKLLLCLLHLRKQALLPLVLRPQRLQLVVGVGQLLPSRFQALRRGLVGLLGQCLDLDLQLHALALQFVQVFRPRR